MSTFIEDITFNGYGLDSDSDPRFTPKGNGDYALNILKSEDGAYGIIVNLKGNRKVTYNPPPSHPWLNCNTYFVLASCYDALTRNVYYWIFSQPVDSNGLS